MRIKNFKYIIKSLVEIYFNKNKILLISSVLAACLLTSINGFSQMKYQRAIGGTGNDYCRSVAKTTDGGVVVAGYTFSFGAGSIDIYVAKLDSLGNMQWAKTFGGSNDDYGYSIIQTTDGGYAIAGMTTSYGPTGLNLYVVKLTSTGGIQWTRTVGGSGSSPDVGYSIVQTTDGGYAVAGYTESYGAGSLDMYVVRLNGSGALQWTRTVGGSGMDQGNSIVQTLDGGFAIAGYTASFGAGDKDVYLVKLNDIGNLEWTRTVGGNSGDEGNGLVQTTDGGYAIVGTTFTYGAGNSDVYIVKFDIGANLSWTRTWGGSNYDYGYSIIQTTDGELAVTGSTNSIGAGSSDVCLVKLNIYGNLSWFRVKGGFYDETGYSLTQNNTGWFVIGGTTTTYGAGLTDMYIIRTDNIGYGCGSQVITGNSTSSGGTASTGGTVSSGGITSSGGTAGTGGILTVICTDPQVPSPPTLISPPNNSTYQSLTPHLDWSSVPGATRYRVQIGPDSTFASSLIDSITTVDSIVIPSGRLTLWIKYYWRVSAGNAAGYSNYSPIWNFRTGLVGIIKNNNEVPGEYQLYDNYPNPFNPVTKIKFSLPPASQGGSQEVKLIVYDILGHEAATLVNDRLAPGTYEAEWNASAFPSGVYFYMLTAGDFTDVKKMVLIK